MKLFSVLPTIAILLFLLSHHHILARNCGVFSMRCRKAGGACNNGCFFVNCINGGHNTFVYGEYFGQVHKNRIEAGCKTTGKSPCTNDAFSQRTFDETFFGYLGEKKLDCDEFPMNAFMQTPFSPGRPRNSIRCIPATENRSGGAQFKNFVYGYGDWSRYGALAHERKCAGTPLRAGDTFAIKFTINGPDGVPGRKQDLQVPFCKKDTTCDNDGLQLHMTSLKKAVSGVGSGRMFGTYNFEKNNQYALTDVGVLRPFRVKITRSSGTFFKVETFEMEGKYAMPLNSRFVSVVPWKSKSIKYMLPHQDLSITSTGFLGTAVHFSIGKFGSTELREGGLEWRSDSKGLRGSYCKTSWKAKACCRCAWQTVCDFPGLAK